MVKKTFKILKVAELGKEGTIISVVIALGLCIFFSKYMADKVKSQSVRYFTAYS